MVAGPPTHTIWDFIIMYFQCKLKTNEFVKGLEGVGGTDRPAEL